MKFLVDSDAGRFTSKLNASVSKKHQSANGYKVKGSPKVKKDKAKEEIPMSEEE
jgi:hypothetical protein